MRTTERSQRPSEAGFTLIELMMVVLVLAILIAVALPSFFSARSRAQDRAAQTLIRSALSAEIVYYGAAQRFSDDNTPGGELASIEPDLTWGSADAGDKGVIATVTGASDQAVILRSTSRTAITFCIGRIESGASAGTYFTIECDGTESEGDIASWPTTVAAGW